MRFIWNLTKYAAMTQDLNWDPVRCRWDLRFGLWSRGIWLEIPPDVCEISRDLVWVLASFKWDPTRLGLSSHDIWTEISWDLAINHTSCMWDLRRFGWDLTLFGWVLSRFGQRLVRFGTDRMRFGLSSHDIWAEYSWDLEEISQDLYWVLMRLHSSWKDAGWHDSAVATTGCSGDLQWERRWEMWPCNCCHLRQWWACSPPQNRKP